LQSTENVHNKILASSVGAESRGAEMAQAQAPVYLRNFLEERVTVAGEVFGNCLNFNPVKWVKSKKAV